MASRFNNKLLLSLIIFNSLIINQIYAQFTPYFQNYSLSDYNAGNQNWGISKGDDGKMYVANNNGLLVFDGLKWSLHEIPNKTTIRSVLADKDRIYTGSYEEFGFWKKNDKGKLEYQSLSHLIDKKSVVNEEFWQILRYKEVIIFRSFTNIYVYDHNTIAQITPNSTVLSCDVVDSTLYISTLTKGISILDVQTKTFKPFIENEILVDAKIVSISNYQNKLLITTSLKGCFLFENGKLYPWNSEVNTIIKEHQLNSFSKLKNGQMVFGTIKNGIYITDAIGKLVFHISKENGLMNNTILDQYVTDTDELWLGLDNGIASLDLTSPHTYYNDVTGRLGAVYDVISFKGTIYIGSNTGLYYIDNQHALNFIEGSQGQVWELKEVNGQLFCGHNEGTFLVENNKIKLISNYTGGWVLTKVPEQKSSYVQGTYSGIVKFEENGKRWKVDHLDNPTIPIRFLTFEDAHTAWAAHAYKGLYKVKFDSTYDSVVQVTDYAKKGLSSDYNVRVYKLKSEICFKTNNGWQKYEPLSDSIVPFDYLNDGFGKNSYIISKDDGDMLAVKTEDFIEFRSFANPDYKLSLPDKYFKKRLIVGYERVSKLNDSVYALSLNDGFMLINSSKKLHNIILQKPVVESFIVDKKFYTIRKEDELEIPAATGTISISVASPNSRNHFFEYAISNLDPNLWLPFDNDKLELSNLNSGSYEILIRASNNSGQHSEITNLNFKVLPRWYNTANGYILFLLVGLVIALIIFGLHKKKVKKEQELLKDKFETEQKIMLKEKTKENDRKLVEIKNEALENEVKLKSKQLANTAMALIKKNETLLELKEELQKSKGGFENPFAFKNLLKKVDHSIGHNDEWKVFEYNFNQVHEEFFNGLKAKFPDLNHKDLKICAYVKMNLTTKEIAPLLNISARGVETQRYRLKRKLNLESDKNLTDFLINFN